MNDINKASVKVKICSLAAEARIMRGQERRRRKHLARREETVANDPVFWSLHNHRRLVVSREARSSLLAYGYMRGRAYSHMEAKCVAEEPNLARVAEILLKYGGPDLIQVNRDDHMATRILAVTKKLEEWMAEVVAPRPVRRRQRERKPYYAGPKAAAGIEPTSTESNSVALPLS